MLKTTAVIIVSIKCLRGILMLKQYFLLIFAAMEIANIGQDVTVLGGGGRRGFSALYVVAAVVATAIFSTSLSIIFTRLVSVICSDDIDVSGSITSVVVGAGVGAAGVAADVVVDVAFVVVFLSHIPLE